MVAYNTISGSGSIAGSGSISDLPTGYSVDLSALSSPFTGALLQSNNIQFLSSAPNQINNSSWYPSTSRQVTVSGCSGIYAGLNGQSFYLINIGSALIENGLYGTFISTNSLLGMSTLDIPGFTLNWL